MFTADQLSIAFNQSRLATESSYSLMWLKLSREAFESANYYAANITTECLTRFVLVSKVDRRWWSSCRGDFSLGLVKSRYLIIDRGSNSVCAGNLTK